MNRKQKIVLLIGILVFVLMGLYPPWIYRTFDLAPSVSGFSYQTTDRFIGYRWFSQGFLQYNDKTSFLSDRNIFLIEKNRLFIQWFMVAVVTGGLAFIFKEPKNKTTTPKFD